MELELPRPGPLVDRWCLDPGVVFLNHGSFGAVPRAVLDEQSRIRTLLEAEPVRFFEDAYQELLDAARRELAAFVRADPQGLALLANATTGVNTVLRSLRLRPRDELLTTDHAYNACRNALETVAAAHDAVVRVVELPFPVPAGDELVDRVLDAVGDRTRLLLVDHVTSPTALVLPLETLVREVQGAGVDVLVDAAHAPGMVDLDLERLGAAYVTGNCHKWLCAPKGAAFLSVREDRRRRVRPLVISHGATAPDDTRSRFHLEHDWTGTTDPSACLSVPAALREVGGMVEGGWDGVRTHNHRLALEARQRLCELLGIDPPCPEAMIGSMVAVPLPSVRPAHDRDPQRRSPLQRKLFEVYRVEAPVIHWRPVPWPLLRVSTQLYNSAEQLDYLCGALAEVLATAT